MIETISPLYTVAMICAVAVIIVLIAGLVLVRRKNEADEEFDAEWMDADKWEESNGKV